MDILRSLNLGSDEVIETAGFMAGVFWRGLIKDKHNNYNILETPLTTMFDGCVYGSFIAIGALIVSTMMPPGAKPIIPIALGASVLYHMSK